MFEYTVERKLYDPHNGKLRLISSWKVQADGLVAIRAEATQVTVQPDNQRASPPLPASPDRDVFMVNGDFYYFTYFRRTSGGSEEQPWRYRNAISRYIPYTDYWAGNLSEWLYRFWAAAVRLGRHMQSLQLQTGRRLKVDVPVTLFPYPHLVRRLEVQTQPQRQALGAYDYAGREVWRRRVLSRMKTPKGIETARQVKTTISEGVVYIRGIQGTGNPATGEGDFYVARQRTAVPAVQLTKTFALWRGRPVLRSVEMTTDEGIKVASLRFEDYRETARADNNLFMLKAPYNHDGTSVRQVMPTSLPYVEPPPPYYVNHPNPAYRRALRRLRQVQASQSDLTDFFFGYGGLMQEQLLAFAVVENALLLRVGWSLFP
ncbi:MAG: hypothetical protein C4335_12530 [Armatimonadota bacterium]